MEIDEQDLAREIDSRSLTRGRGYWREGRVLSVEQVADDQYLAKVRGSGSNRYYAKILLEPRRKGSAIHGLCSCPVGFNCKHVAAALLELIHQRRAAGVAGLPEGTGGWLERLRRAAGKPATAAAPRPERILYLLDLQPGLDGNRLAVTTRVATPRKSGGFGKPRPFTAGATSSAGFVLAEDRRLLWLLQPGRSPAVAGRHLLDGSTAEAVLTLLAAIGRAYWRDPQNPPLHHAGPRTAELRWQADPEGGQRVVAAGLEKGLLLLPAAPPWWLDPDGGGCGPLETGLAAGIAEVLAAAPAIDAESAARLAETLAGEAPELPRPEPAGGGVTSRGDIEPRPCLRLYSEAWDDGEWLDQAALHFDYDGVAVHPFDGDDPLREGPEGRETIRRRHDLEERIFGHLEAAGLVPSGFMGDGDALELEADGDPTLTWAEVVIEHLPRWHGDGWRIEIDPSFRFRLKEPGQWYGEVAEGGGGSWFDLELGVEVEGRRVNLLPILAASLGTLAGQLEQLEEEAPLLCPSEAGLLRLPAGRLRKLIAALVELYDPDALGTDGRLRLNRLQAPRLAELEEAEVSLAGGERLRDYGRRLAGFRGIERVPAPAGLAAELRPYQREGLDWLQFLRRYDLGGVLADDMGLGKTVQTLAHLLVEHEAGRADRPSLVIAPTSLMVNWRLEAERFAPELRVLVLQGPGRKELFDRIPDHHLVLTTYPLLVRDAAALTAHPWHLLVLDEAQQLKNPKAKAWGVARQLEARHRLALTGTPMENHLGELWSLFDLLLPGLLGETRRFRRLFRNPIEREGDGGRRSALGRRIAPFLLRREKGAVVAELPPKSEIVTEVELDGAQRDLYETIRVSLSAKVREEIARKGLARSHITVLDALLKLRQACCHPRLLKLEAAAGVKESAKLELLMEMLPELVEEGRRVLLFSQFTSMLKLIEEAVTAAGIGYVKLTGATRDRATPVARFQGGEVPLFLISLKAGGTGLNLTAADTVIHYDPWWNPAVERQATDRAHRIGQDKPVFVYKLIARGTVEEKIQQLQARKQALADALFAEGGTGAAAFTAEELQALFEPLG